LQKALLPALHRANIKTVGVFKLVETDSTYGEVLAGSDMPNLMYMTSFETQTSRDEHWKAFGNDPQWKRLVGMPEYQNNVSKIVIGFSGP
jgi:hypothetical protein